MLDKQQVLSRLKVSDKALACLQNHPSQLGSASLLSAGLLLVELTAAVQAELRANVFLAINDQDIRQGGIGEHHTSCCQCLVQPVRPAQALTPSLL